MTKKTQEYSHFSLGEEVMVEILTFHVQTGTPVITMHPGMIVGKYLETPDGKDSGVKYSVKLDGGSKCFDCNPESIQSSESIQSLDAGSST